VTIAVGMTEFDPTPPETPADRSGRPSFPPSFLGIFISNRRPSRIGLSVARSIEYKRSNYKVVEEGGSNSPIDDDVGGVTLRRLTPVEGELFDDNLTSRMDQSNGDSPFSTRTGSHRDCLILPYSARRQSVENMENGPLTLMAPPI